MSELQASINPYPYINITPYTSISDLVKEHVTDDGMILAVHLNASSLTDRPNNANNWIAFMQFFMGKTTGYYFVYYYDSNNAYIGIAKENESITWHSII